MTALGLHVANSGRALLVSPNNRLIKGGVGEEIGIG